MTVTSYVLPTSVAEAVGLLGAHGPDLLVLAGGTVAMPLVNEGVMRADAGDGPAARRDGRHRARATAGCGSAR